MRALTVMIALKKMFSSKGVYFRPNENLLLQSIGYRNEKGLTPKELKKEFIETLRAMKDIRSAEICEEGGMETLQILFDQPRMAYTDQLEIRVTRKEMMLRINPTMGDFSLDIGGSTYHPTVNLASSLEGFVIMQAVMKEMGLILDSTIGEEGIYLLPEWALPWIRRRLDLGVREPGTFIWYFPTLEARSFESAYIRSEEDIVDGSSEEIDGDDLIRGFMQMKLDQVYETLVKRERECFNEILMEDDVEKEWSNRFDTIAREQKSYENTLLINLKTKWDPTTAKNFGMIEFQNDIFENPSGNTKRFPTFSRVDFLGGKWNYVSRVDMIETRNSLQQIPFVEKMSILWDIKATEFEHFELNGRFERKVSNLFNPYYAKQSLYPSASPYKYIGLLAHRMEFPDTFPPNILCDLSKRMRAVKFDMSVVDDMLTIRVIDNVVNRKPVDVPEIYISLAPNVPMNERVYFANGNSGFLSVFPHMITYTKAYEALQFFLDGSGCFEHSSAKYDDIDQFTQFILGARPSEEDHFDKKYFSYFAEMAKEEKRLIPKIEEFQMRFNDAYELDIFVRREGEEVGCWLRESGKLEEMNNLCRLLYRNMIQRAEAGFLNIAHALLLPWDWYLEKLNKVWLIAFGEGNSNAPIREIEREGITLRLDKEKDRVEIDDQYYIEKSLEHPTTYRYLFDKKDSVIFNPEKDGKFLNTLYSFLIAEENESK